MFVNQHPYISIYLLGSLSVVFLSFFKIILFYVVDWITKGNILSKNLKKLEKKDTRAWYQKSLIFIGVLLLEAALSWINVVVVLVQIPYTLFKVLRDVFTQTPEEVKALRFPLKNNPMLSTESVWAYVIALNVKIGAEIQNADQIVYSLEDILEKRPDFKYQEALDNLEKLNVIDSNVLASVKNSFVPMDDADGYYNEFVFDPAKNEDDWYAEMRLEPSLKQYTIYSRTPDYHGQYYTLYEYKIEDREIYIRVSESKTDYLTEITYDIKDNVVLESEVRDRMSEQSFMSSDDEIDEKIKELNEEIEWQKILTRFKYFIMLRHRDVFDSSFLAKYYQSELERINNGFLSLEKNVENFGGYIVFESEEDIYSYNKISCDEDVLEENRENLRSIYENMENYNISRYEFEHLNEIKNELESYMEKL